ncbi:uncharacterized protein LOC143181047 [Calliopsis andreniformis]|uniref:uncharacterized protein LOC143181047 n=1 Tax=Calliopsis andreniformis TaxID=337506 RepID=UPI003FCE3D6E
MYIEFVPSWILHYYGKETRIKNRCKNISANIESLEFQEYDVTSILTYTVILASFLFNIFIFCYIGELVADQWKMVGEASYMADWYRLPGKRKLNFVLIIAMSNSSKKLTAGNLIELSLNTFSDVSIPLLSTFSTRIWK